MSRFGIRLRVVGAIGLAFIACLALSFSQTGTTFAGRRQVQTTQEAAGEVVFNQNCAVCHGPKATGRLGPPLNVLPPQVASLPPEAVAQNLTGLVRGGIPGRMPMFTPELLSGAQILDVTRYLLSLNGSLPSPSLYEAIAPVTADKAKGRTFYAPTGHSVGGEFRTFWQRYGGVRVFGLPLSEEYNGVSPEDGKMYRMQLFERARLEMHPDAPAGQRVQLALLGAEELRLRTHFVGAEGGEGGAP